MNLAVFNNFGWHNHTELTEQASRMDTYQTTSKIANYLLYLGMTDQLIKEDGKLYFKIPKTFLMQIPGRSEVKNYSCDDNSFVLQEDVQIQDAVCEKLEEVNGKEQMIVSKKIEEIKPKAIKQIAQVIIGTGLWDVRQNLLIDETDGSLVQSDIEQAMDANPQYFFNKNKTKFWSDAAHGGIEGLALQLQSGLNQGYEIKELCNVLRETVMANPFAQQSPKAELMDKCTQFKYE